MKSKRWWRAVSAFGLAWAATVAAAAPDAAAMWRDFLANGTSETVYDGYDLFDALGYDLDRVDAGACREHADGIADGLRKAPVSIALHHVALLCARATGDDKAAAEQSALLDALSAEALSQASDIDDTPPIRVLGLQDAYTLLHLADLTLLYSYFPSTKVDRHFPVVMAGWDDQAGVERHLRFDMVDVVDAITRGQPTSGFPYQRALMAEGMLRGMQKSDQLAAADILAVKDAFAKDAMTARVAALRPAAERGGLQSIATWIVVCDLRSYDGCADGLVDALLPQAEKKHALPMTLLAYAYAQGVGVARDEAAAKTLLAGADRRWPRAAASEAFATMWLTLHHDAPIALVESAIASARAAGNRNIVRDLARLAVDGKDKPSLDDADIAVLQQPEQNATGAGENILADYYRKLGDKERALEWVRKAAADGSPEAQAALGRAMLFGDGVPRDRDAGIAMLRDAAAGGNVLAMRVMASMSEQEGRWQDAANWLMGGVSRNDVDAILDMAWLMENGHAQAGSGVENAVRVYEQLGDPRGVDLAEARRRLAEMALDGRGMKKDPERARELLSHDAEKGDAVSQARLGVALLGGEFGKPDETGGRKWLERSMQAGNADAYDAFADWLYGRKTPDARRQAIEAWEKAIALGSNQAVNNLAWFRCVSPDPVVRDAKSGLQAMQDLAKRTESGPGWQDTEAACLAATGDYEAAAKLQQDVIDKVERLQPDDPAALRQFEERRALYAAGKPYMLGDGDDD
jgi:TPR repeat protein